MRTRESSPTSRSRCRSYSPVSLTSTRWSVAGSKASTWRASSEAMNPAAAVMPTRILEELAGEELACMAGADDEYVLDACIEAAERISGSPQPGPELDAAHRDEHQRGRDHVHRQRNVPRAEERIDAEEEDRDHADRECEVQCIDDAGVLPRCAVDAE